jgi:diketogulonate reductase-like aldo/keto reductase
LGYFRVRPISPKCSENHETHIRLYSLYGDNEELLGKWFQRTGKRDQIFLATKFGYVKGSKTFEINSTGAYCKKACDASLKALGTNYVDLCTCLFACSDTIKKL